MEDHMEAKEIHTMQITSFLQTAYDANFKLMIIWYAEETNNCGALGKYRTSQVNISC
jgi:hypothetical protein